MAAFEHEQPLLGGRPAAARDPHVFAAATRRRARALQLGALCAAVLSLAWIAALTVALLGADALPGALPAAKASPAPPPAPIGAPERAAARSVPRAASGHRSPESRREIHAAAVPAAPAQATAQASTTVASPAAPVAPPAAPAAPPVAPRQGWARRGWTAPPGHVKPDRAPPRGGDGGSSAAGDVSGTTPDQSGSHSRNG
jgi:hypothetical protein